MSVSAADVKIPLPQFLKLMTNGNVPVAKAMAAAGKIYKEYGSPGQLVLLTDFKLKGSGIEDAADRKLILAAFRKAGYAPKKTALKRKKTGDDEDDSTTTEAGPSHVPAMPLLTTPTKRKRLSEKNEFLPSDPSAGEVGAENLDFEEVLDEHVLNLKHTVVNRAPVMAAWAAIVAERLNFQRPEALSIASVYTEMNALSKGVSLGIYDKNKETGMEASRAGVQPYVELMGRRPVYRTRDEQWRALSNGNPVPPMTAFGYISRSFRQNRPYVIGAMRLLAESYSPTELSTKGWSLYTEFRPAVDQWGKRSELSCSKILSLRKEGAPGSLSPAVKADPAIQNPDSQSDLVETHTASKTMSLEEYEAALDEDHTFDDVDLDFGGNK
ncbi:hypothetical protein D9611_002454 [Ephemerocybe angulata]|uniref:Uncharacterized protein n=1 Tax=Ephemerocybe angulata TaxID=980116 RepID=A0A8H5C1N8_9AGAR|nr:hypothetical protein D9611_002454 [Tulosesus angulatus]